MLYLWMPEANGVWQWSKGENWVQASSLEQLIQDIKPFQGEEAVVFFPSREVQILQQNLTKQQYKQLGAEGVKYLLEEFVILPIDQMKVFSHFNQPDLVSVLGIAHANVLTMQHSLSLISIKIISLLPDFLILPVPLPNQTVLANVHGRLLVRENEWKGNSIDDLALYLEFENPDRHYLYAGLTDEQVESLFAISTTDRREAFSYQFKEIKQAKSHPYNVLPKAKSENAGLSGYWKACIAVFVVLLLVQFSYDLLRYVKLKNIGNQTADLAINQYKTWFGANGQVTEQDLKNQFQGRLNANQSANTQAIQLLSRVGPILMQQHIIANQVNYESSILNMTLQAKSSDVLQALVQQLNQQGFKAELGNVQTQGANVVGLVKIQ
ncbi:type II secretion system protein GspL [Acinetobacter gerneri]|uniref:type II secretion system protein GspL n=1 Tax=Acinetobacter gerneri TaxID=202952 RepID=UPI003215950E